MRSNSGPIWLRVFGWIADGYVLSGAHSNPQCFVVATAFDQQSRRCVTGLARVEVALVHALADPCLEVAVRKHQVG